MNRKLRCHIKYLIRKFNIQRPVQGERMKFLLKIISCSMQDCRKKNCKIVSYNENWHNHLHQCLNKQTFNTFLLVTRCNLIGLKPLGRSWLVCTWKGTSSGGLSSFSTTTWKTIHYHQCTIHWRKLMQDG